MSELDDLAGLLNSKTIQGKIHWTMDDETRLHTIQGKSFLEIWKYADPDDDFVGLAVRNDNGVILAQEYFYPKSESYKALDQVIGIAKRKSLGVDEALSDLKARLQAL